MTTVAQAVSDIIRGSQFLEDGLAKGIINYAYLADMIQQDVEHITRKRANRYAIVMALRRLTDSLSGSFVAEAASMLKGASVTATSGMFDMTVRKGKGSVRSSMGLYDMVDFDKGDFLAITYGAHEINIISNAKYLDKMSMVFTGSDIINTVSGMSSIMVRITKEAAGAVGLLYVITKALSWENINIIEVVSTRTEEIFMVDERDAARAFDALGRLVAGK